MVQINLYHPGSVDVMISFPNTWNDLSEKELHFISNVLLNQTEKNANESRPFITKFILDERTKKIKLPVNFFNLLDPEEIVRSLFPLLDFIMDSNDRTNTPAAMGKFICRPFDEITCGEFEDCEMAAARFAEKNEAKPLAEIAAILFRPKGEEYIRYNSRTDSYLTYAVDKKVNHFIKLPAAQLYSIFIWYAGGRSQLQLYFPDVYEKGKKNGTPDPMVFTNTIHAGAGPKNGSRNQIRRMKLYEFLYDCNQEAIKAKELEAEYAKHNK